MLALPNQQQLHYIQRKQYETKMKNKHYIDYTTVHDNVKHLTLYQIKMCANIFGVSAIKTPLFIAKVMMQM